MKRIALLFVFISVVFFLILALKEDAPGKNSWFHELSGDWSLRISSSWYEVGNSLEYNNKYVLFQQTRNESLNQYHLKTIVDGIDRIGVAEEWILMEMDNEWKLYSYNNDERTIDIYPRGRLWLNLHTGKTSWSFNNDDFAVKAPSVVQSLVSTLHKPVKSNRNVYFFVSGLLFIIFLYCCCKISLEQFKKYTILNESGKIKRGQILYSTKKKIGGSEQN